MQLPRYKNVGFLRTGTITLPQSVDKYTNVKALMPENSLLPLNIRVVNNSNVHQPEVESNGKNNLCVLNIIGDFIQSGCECFNSVTIVGAVDFLQSRVA